MANFTNPSSQDAAEDAARLLQRLGFVVLALGGSCAEALSSRSIFLFFPIGAALLLVAAVLDPVRGVGQRLYRVISSPLAWVCFGLFGWAALSLAWAPSPAWGVQHLLKLAATAAAPVLIMACGREHTRATDLYLFPIGALLAMIAILVLALARHAGVTLGEGRLDNAGVSLVVLLFPAMAGLAARGRNGLARLLMILALAFTFAIGEPQTATALLVGFTALSFAISDVRRTVYDLSLFASAIVLFAPVLPAISPTLGHWFFQAKLASLPEAFAPLAAAADIVLHDPLRILTGHGVDAVVAGVEAGALPAQAPRVILFEIWYELGIVGALLSAAAVWLAFRGVGAMGAKVAPYLVAALACDLALGFISRDLTQMGWVSLLAVSAVSAGAAARSQYRTTRPSAAGLAHL